MGRDAHFFDNVRPFFCVAAPIDAPDGQRLGALDITSYDSVPAFTTMFRRMTGVPPRGYLQKAKAA